MLGNHSYATKLTPGVAPEISQARSALIEALKSSIHQYRSNNINAEQLVDAAEKALCEAEELDDTASLSTQFFSDIKELARIAARAVLGPEWEAADDITLNRKAFNLAIRALESRSSHLAYIAHDLLWLTTGGFNDFGGEKGFEIYCELETLF